MSPLIKLSFLTGLSVFSGFLMYLGWPNIGFFPFIFIGLVPLFFAIQKTEYFTSKWRILVLFLIVFIAHFVWIGASLRWLHETSPKTYYIAITLESLSISVACLPIYLVKKKLGENSKWAFFIASWLTVEYFNQQWMMGTPYFVLGGAFGMHPQMIQVYEFMGVEGGTLFILLSNLGFFMILKNFLLKRSMKMSIIFTTVSISPFVLSLLFDTDVNKPSKRDAIRVAAMHSFTETYSEEAHQYPDKKVEELWKHVKIAELKNCEVLFLPETIVSNVGWLSNIANERAYKSLFEKIEIYPDLSICFGGYGYSVAQDGEDPYTTFDKSRNFYFNTHNVAITVNHSGRWPIRSKEIFIPFQERIPFLKQLPILKSFADIVGTNTMVSYYQFGDNIHKTMNGNKFVPVLCFESLYPIRMAENAKESNFIAILANEYWNRDLSGSDQYLYTNVGMAIQSRTPIIRSSNSGVSAIIDDKGNILSKKRGNQPGVISNSLKKKTEETFYEMISGLIYGMGVIGFVSLVVFSLIKVLFQANKKA